MARRHNIETRLTATDKTKAAFNRVQKRMKSLKKASLVAGGGVAAVAAGFVAASKRAVNFGDNIAKTSRQIDISTKAFQELRLAADLAGVSEEKFGGALAKLSKNIGEFREGTGTLVTFLDKLGDNSFANLLRKTTDTEQAFKVFIKRMDQAANQQQKLALANAAFGRGVGQMLAGMSFKELEKGVALAQKFGIAIEDNLLKKAEEIKDAFTLAAAVFKKEFFSVMLETLSKMDLKSFAEDMAKIAKFSIKAALGIARFFNIIEKEKLTAVQLAEQELGAARKSLEITKTQARGSAEAVQNQIKKQERKVELLKEQVAQLKWLAKLPPQKDMGFIPTRTEPLYKAPIHTVPEATPAQTKKFAKLQEQLTKYRAGIKATSDNLQLLNQSTFANVEALENEAQRLETTKNVRALINNLKRQGYGISAATEQAMIAEANAVDTLNRKLQKKIELLEPGPIQEYIDRTKDLNTSLQEVAVRGADRLTESLVGIMNGTQKAGEAFKSMARSIIADMQRMIIKKMILDKVMGFIEGMLPGANAGGKTGAKPKPKATGGPVGTGRPYIVGEKGPELLVPRRNGHIVPNNAMGGAVVNQTINIETGVSQTVRAEIMQLMPQINESTKNAILDARRRGGSFADGFA